jgi:hypothetical protein
MPWINAHLAEGDHASAKATFRPRYSVLDSNVNCPGPVGFAVVVYDLPASDAALPVATTLVPRAEAAQPVTLPSAIVSASFPCVSTYTTVAPGLRTMPCSETKVAFGPSHSQIYVPVTIPSFIGPESM